MGYIERMPTHSSVTRLSQLYFYTLRHDPSDAELISHKLLVRAGYIKKVSQGIFVYGPLMLRVLRKFENIVRRELDARGCSEITMPMVQPATLWQQSGRWEQMDTTLLRFKNRLQQDYCLGPTHEEVVVDYVRGQLNSYRDLPKNIYQIQTKYRDEIRPRFGLLRGREFIMKDAYSFDASAEAAKQHYQRMHEAYVAIFKSLGVQFVCVAADSGDIGGDHSQEFHITAERGESELLISREGEFASNTECCKLKAGDPSPCGTGALELVRGIEVGHIFYLGTKYSKLMKAFFINAEGAQQAFEMGCYGIGISRTAQAVVEQSHDAKGIVWPECIAPYDVHICLLDKDDPACTDALQKLQTALSDKQLLLDDRGLRPGVQFKDADLVGLPWRVNIGSRGLKQGGVEVVHRKTGRAQVLKLADDLRLQWNALDNSHARG